MARSRLHRRYVKNPSSEPRHNPPLFTDIVEFVAPGFAGFAITRFATRVAATQIEQRKPSWGKHAGAAASLASFLGAWLLAHKWKWLEKYHTPIVVGSAIAALQSLIQLYLPKLGWMVADATPELEATAATEGQLTATPEMQLQPVDEDPNEYVYNDAYDSGRYGRPSGVSPMQHGAGTAGSGPGGPAEPDMSDLAIDDAIGQSGNLGVFTNN